MVVKRVNKKVVKKKSDNSFKKIIENDMKMVKNAIKKDAKSIKKKTKKMTSKKPHKPKKYICFNCHNEIAELDKQVLITTSDRGKIIQEIGFHFDCWAEYFNKCVTKKVKQNVATVQKKVVGLMDNPIVKSMLMNIKGADSVFTMLQTPLTEDAVDDLKEDMKDDRKKGTNKI